MRIGIDMSRTAETKTGLGSYAASLVAALARIDAHNDYTLYPYTWHCFVDDYDRAYRPDARNFRVSRSFLPQRLVRWLWRENKLDKDWLVGDPPDVFFSPFHSAPPRPLRRLVCVFHDISFLTHPRFTTDQNRLFCEDQLRQALLRADLLLTVSEFSRAEMVRVLGISPERIRVVKEAADPRFRTIPDVPLGADLEERIGLLSRFLLYVGSVEPRKNLITLIRAYATLDPDTPPLVIAGGSGWKNSEIYAEVEQRGLSERIRFTGFVSDAELVALYNRAELFLFPTIYEGFGLPVIEAMACGCPVITTRVSSIPEVGGDAVVYCDDPTNVEELAKAIRSTLADPDLLRRLAAAGPVQAATFSWEKAARETLALLQEVHEQPQFHRHEVIMGEDERGLGRGWFDLEQVDGRPARWSTTAAELHLHPRLEPGGDTLEVEAASAVGDGRQTLTVRCGSRRFPPVRLETGFHTYRFETPAGLPHRDLKIRLELNQALPAEQLGGDPRQLGIQVRAVRLVKSR